MSREFGTFPIAANYEPQVAAPFDARSLVKTKAALTNPATWIQADGGLYIYSGMLVVVYDDIENNGLYILKDRKNYTAEISWMKLADVSQITALEAKIDAIVSGPVALRRDNDYNYKKIENTFIPVNGEVCFVDVAGYGLRMKVGDGISTFAQLPYTDETLLQKIDGVIVKGYFYQNEFYLDSAHAQLLDRMLGRIYIDAITSKIYTFDGMGYILQNSEIPRASAQTAGIMKLYDETGHNTDGTMTQRAITEELDEKFEMLVDHDDEMLIFDKDLY